MSGGSSDAEGETEGARACLRAWREVLGETKVVVDSAELDRAATATFATHAHPSAILRPTTVEEIRACVRAARTHGARLHPISRGHNWGLGSRAPAADQAALLDLSGMNRILAHDRELATLTVEPGVSFAQAHRYVAEQSPELFLPVIGGSPGASVLANALQRGDRVAPHLDRMSSLSDLEVVLGTGELVRTGLGRFAGAKAQGLLPAGFGPSMAGLFSQSHLGVVTRGTLHLWRKPLKLLTFRFSTPDTGALPGPLRALHELVLEGTLAPNCLTLWNAYKFLATRGRYPWSATSGQTPLRLKELGGKQAWYGFGALYAASDAIGVALRQRVRERLASEVDGLRFSLAETDTPSVYLGVPTAQNLRSAYWRKRGEPPADADPDRDGCGLLWLCPALPPDGEVVAEICERIEALILDRGFEPNIGFTAISARALHAFVAIAYDREIEGEDERAMACHDACWELLLAEGHFPHRLGLATQGKVPPADDDSDAVWARLRQALDPDGVLIGP